MKREDAIAVIRETVEQFAQNDHRVNCDADRDAVLDVLDELTGIASDKSPRVRRWSTVKLGVITEARAAGTRTHPL